MWLGSSGNVQQSAVAEHATSEMHDIDWEKAEVVDCHPHYRQRCALEAWHIRTEPHKMNRDGGPLPAVYNPLIHHPRRPHWEPAVVSTQHSIFLPYFTSYYSIYISCSALTHPNSVHARMRIITHHLLAAPPSSPPEVVPPFPAFCTYKVTLPCTLDHYSLRRALDWAETSEFLPLTSVHSRLVWLQE